VALRALISVGDLEIAAPSGQHSGSCHMTSERCLNAWRSARGQRSATGKSPLPVASGVFLAAYGRARQHSFSLAKRRSWVSTFVRGPRPPESMPMNCSSPGRSNEITDIALRIV